MPWDYGHALVQQLRAVNSPLRCIKTAYVFGRELRALNAEATQLPKLVAVFVDEPFGGNPMWRYVRGGFVAGFESRPLPTKYEVDCFAPTATN